MKTPIGIFAGTFDPVHEGHVEFVKNALQTLGLEKIYIVPEHEPRRKQQVSPIADRVSMLKLAFEDTKQVSVYPNDQIFSTFAGMMRDAKLKKVTHLLVGSDVVFGLKTWPELEDIISKLHLAVGVRNKADETRIHTLMAHLGVLPSGYSIIHTKNTDKASSQVRSKITSFHPKIQDYIKKHHLYKV
ncbi:MAG TPA: adenylyltransferase/cytidyltransferase family protein [Candidatus Saccharibacteria bacterium]|nr:adenylyltransferase/cytidyltransferase family protein [Candidatus Saccharibacteria bacterium]